MQLHQALSLRVGVLGLLVLIVTTADISARAADPSFIGPLNTVTTLSSTIPPNGDVNPYGVARVPESKGTLVQGNFLISNFNNTARLRRNSSFLLKGMPSAVPQVLENSLWL